MSVKRRLRNSLMEVLKNDRAKSYTTRYDRKGLLVAFVNDLFRLGYKIEDIRSLQSKHVLAVVTYWKEKGLANSSIKNRTAAIRTLVRFIGKVDVVPTNKALLIPPRKYVSNVNRALVNPDFCAVSDVYIKTSLELQRVFGLRREESLKIKPHLADRKVELVLDQNWCKGGRGRSIPIKTSEQRYWLEQAKKLVGSANNSLIPNDKKYITQRHLYDKQVGRAGLRNLHGLRHAYAQTRYKELTGWEAPINGGLNSKQLTQGQKKIDYEARMTLTGELGHSREQITVNYLGR